MRAERPETLKTLLAIPVAYAVFVAHTSVAPVLQLGVWTPQIVPWGLVLATLWLDPRVALVAATLAGIVSDSLSAESLGIDVVVFVVATWALSHALRRPPIHSTVVLATATGVFTMLTTFSSSGLRLLMLHERIDWPHALATAGAAGVSTAIVSLAAWQLIHIVTRGTGRNAGPRQSVANRWRMLTE